MISTGGGEPRRLPSGEAQSLDWSPRTDEIAYGSGSGLQRVIRTDGSKPQRFFRAHSKPPGLGLPTWSPDGTHIGFAGHVLYGRHFGGSDWYDAIYVADADGSNLHLVTSHAYNEYGFAWSPDGRSISPRPGEPQRHLHHRLRRAEQPPADGRLASPHRVGRSRYLGPLTGARSPTPQTEPVKATST